MADKKNELIVFEVFKRAQEKQSESLSKPCTTTFYDEGAVPHSKPHNYSFRAAAREKWVKNFFLLEKDIKLESTQHQPLEQKFHRIYTSPINTIKRNVGLWFQWGIYI